MHLNRFVIELLRSLVVAVHDRDVGQDEQRAAMLHDFAAVIGGVSRLQGERGSLLVVAKLERGKPLKKQRERHDPCITTFAAQRQRLGRKCPNFGVTPAERVHVRQTDQRPRSEPSSRVSDRERPFEPELSFLVQAALRPEPEQRASKFDALLGKGRRRQGPFERRRTFSCSIRSCRRHGT